MCHDHVYKPQLQKHLGKAYRYTQQFTAGNFFSISELVLHTRAPSSSLQKRSLRSVALFRVQQRSNTDEQKNVAMR
jgi:hypothetical protein